MKPSFPSRVEHRQGRGQGHSVACVRVKGARFEVPERIRGQEAGSMISEAHVTSGPQRCSGLCDEFGNAKWLSGGSPALTEFAQGCMLGST